MENEVYLAALAGLLHDVGKFAQRAGVGRREIADEEARRDVKYEHALAGYSFVQDFAGALPAEARRELSGVAYHHAPKSDADERVRLADWLSAGERDEADGAKDDQRVPYLRSVFSRLGGFDEGWYLPLKCLRFDRRVIFPQRLDPSGWKDAYRDEYFALWEEFEQACRLLKGISDPQLYLETLYQRLLEYTWCIPSAYYHTLPDVSLYDHSRMTAALAACLAQDGRSGEWCRAVEDDDQVAVLVAGDISGVQNFIYTLASSGAAKTLRGRSFYLQLLTEVVAQYLLHELGLPLTNLLYAGGGNFYLIAPLQPRRPLADLQAEVTRKLFDAHEGNLRLALAWTPVQAAEFKSGAFVRAWDRLHERLRRVKERPLAELTADVMGKEVGAAYGEGGDVTTCPICGREEKGVGEDGCRLCRSFADLGRQVAHATHLVMAVGTPAKPRPRIDRWHQGLEQFGVNVWVVDVGHPETGGKYLPGGPGQAEWVRLYPLHKNQDEAREQALIAEAQAKLNAPLVRAFRPFAQIVPLAKDGGIKTFDELAKDSRGIERWGVLRMDVDNLGDLFRKGFRRGDRDCLTLSRVAALSFSLRLFFEGYLSTIGRRWKGKLYLQYAGGDDLFIVGAWDALPEFAAEVRKQFGEYVCDNPCVTLSGGISLHPEKFPLYRAAEEAHEAEQKAKRHKRRQQVSSGQGQEETWKEKDALCFLDLPMEWEEFRDVQILTERLEGWISSGAAPKALLQNLLILYGEWRAGHERAFKKGKLKRHQFYFGPWLWHAAYQLTRTAAAKGTPEEVRTEIRNWLNNLIRNQTLIVRLGLAARWAELLTRL